MSAADRIEAACRALDLWADDFPGGVGPIKTCVALRAIAAELRGAPALTEAERAFFEAALVLAEMRQTGVEFSVFEHSDRTANFDAAYRALRTERTPS